MSSSTLSVTDVEVFKKLSNPLIVDLKDDAHTKATLQMQNAMHKAAEKDTEEAPIKRKSALEDAQKEVQNEDKVEEKQTKFTLEEPTHHDTPVRSGTPKAQDNANTSNEEKLEKQGYLIELNNLRQKGIELSREFTMDDSLEELEFEVSKQNNNMNTRNTVAFMRDMLRIIINGIEISNNRFGPFLSINGWSESCTQDMQKYEHSLERIYKLYFRRSQMSPVMELAWLLFGSMIAWHFKSKFFGPAVNQPTPRPKERTSEMPSSEKMPAQRRNTQKSTRPVLRPPNFGI